MASVSTYWWGFEVKLSHAETCAWTHPSVTALAALVATKIGGPIGSAVVGAIAVGKNYIRTLNQKSSYKGVILKFLWPGTYVGVRRRGSSPWSSSPCP